MWAEHGREKGAEREKEEAGLAGEPNKAPPHPLRRRAQWAERGARRYRERFR